MLNRLKQEWQKSPALLPGKQKKKLGLVWRNRKKLAQLAIYLLYLPFFLLINLWSRITLTRRISYAAAIILSFTLSVWIIINHSQKRYSHTLLHRRMVDL
jgi:hypothetical protein